MGVGLRESIRPKKTYFNVFRECKYWTGRGTGSAGVGLVSAWHYQAVDTVEAVAQQHTATAQHVYKMSPTRMTEATLELDSIHNKLMFKPAHVLVYIKPHPRCRVCAFGYNPLLHNPNGYGASFCGGMFCARYQLLDPRFLDFVAFCCYLQDIFYKHCANQRKSPLWEQLPGYCREQQWWWNRVNMFQLQCERSLVFLAPHLEQMMAGVLGAGALSLPCKNSWANRHHSTRRIDRRDQGAEDSYPKVLRVHPLLVPDQDRPQ